MDGRETTFAFKFLIESVSRSSPNTECGSPGIRFRLLDFPAVTINLPELNRQISDGGCVPIKKGKSCLFQSTLGNLVNVLHERMLQVEFVDLSREVLEPVDCIEPVVKGSAFLDIHGTARALEKTVESSGKLRCSGTERKELIILDCTGKKMISLHVKYQLMVVSTLGNKLKLQTARIQDKNGGACGAHVIRSPSKIKCGAELSSNPQRFTLNGLDINSNSKDEEAEHSTSDENDSITSNEHLYLPNSVCPPPLFYHSDSPSRPIMPKDGANEGADGFKGCTVMNAHIHQENQSETQHWSVLMQHDHSHPLNTTLSSLPQPKRRAVEDQEDEIKDAPCSVGNSEESTPLPLLSALLTELTLLKSHVEPGTQTTSEMLKQLLLQRKTEMVSKCMQTDTDSTLSSKHHQKVISTNPDNKAQNQRSTASSKFIRECCGYRHADAQYTSMVPKNKSVLYPPHIAHKRKRKRVNNPTRVLHTNTPPKQRSKQKNTTHHIRNQPKARRNKPATTDPSHEMERVNSSNLPSPGQGVKTLEVFIPQASYISKSLDTSPLSGSRNSVYSQEKETKMAVCSDVGIQTCASIDVETQTCTLGEITQRKEHTSQGDIQGTTMSEKYCQTNIEDDNHPSSEYSSLLSIESKPDSPRDASLSSTIAKSHDKEPLETRQAELPSTPINIVITEPSQEKVKRELSLSQELPTPPRHKSTENLSLLHFGKKHNSLLNIASQTLDSFMSTDSLDAITSAVLPKHCVLYLATSQSTSLDLSGGDDNGPVLSQENAVTLDNAIDVESCESNKEYSSLDYSDDFEQFESDSGTQSNSS